MKKKNLVYQPGETVTLKNNVNIGDWPYYLKKGTVVEVARNLDTYVVIRYRDRYQSVYKRYLEQFLAYDPNQIGDLDDDL